MNIHLGVPNYFKKYLVLLGIVGQLRSMVGNLVNIGQSYHKVQASDNLYIVTTVYENNY